MGWAVAVLMARLLAGNRKGAHRAPRMPQKSISNGDGLLGGHGHGGEPAEAVRSIAAHDAEEVFLQSARDRADAALAHADLVHRPHWRDLRRGASEEDFVGD